MELNEIKTFFTENADKDDVKSYLAELSKIDETAIFDKFKKTDEYKVEFDKAVTKAVQNHDEKIKPKLEKELRDKIQLELNPPKDPAVLALQNQLEELKQAQAEKDALLNQEKRVNFLHQSIQPEYKEFIKLFDGSIQDDAEKVKFINTQLFNLQAAGTSKPAQSKQTNTKSITREDLKNMTPEEINKARIDGKLDSILSGVQ
jgi:hypothetical protein